VKGRFVNRPLLEEGVPNMAMERTKLTTPEFLEWSERPENRDRLFELIDGEVIEKVASFTLSKIAGWILTYINMYMMKNPIGYVTGADGRMNCLAWMTP
jgi:Uma2 family endonuclease